MTSMDNVLQLVNRLQSACTLLGDTAGGKDSDLPTLWNMLPSIVVIGGQVNMPELAAHLTKREMRQEVCSGFSTAHVGVVQPAKHTIARMPQSYRHGIRAAESAGRLCASLWLLASSNELHPPACVLLSTVSICKRSGS